MKNKETLAQKISSILMEQGTISSEESKALQKVFKESAKETFVNFLLEEGLVDEAGLLKALAKYYQVPGFDVVGYFFNTHLLRMFPEDFLTRNACIPVEVDENIMIMTVSEPDNSTLLARIGEHVSYGIRFRVGIRRDIVSAAREFYDKPFTREPLTKEYPDLREKRQLKQEADRVEDGQEDEEIEFTGYSEEEE